jgi:hypothetical protein
MRQGVWSDEAMEVRFQRAGHCGRSTGSRAIQQALWPLMRTALHPFSACGMGHVEGRGDGVDMVACHNLTDGLRTAKDPRLLGLLQDGLSGRQRMIGKAAVEGAQCFAPWGRMLFVSHMTFGA